jgi:4-amino-4-deoxy-L-arabinose transferase-like glycosyltransferase
MMRKLHYALLLVALLIGAGVRINGIEWGLPDRVHAAYSYHPDEASLLEWASDLYHGRIISKQFIYGGTFYLSTLEAGSRLSAALVDGHEVSLRDRMGMARAGSALFAVLAIAVTYAAGATLFTPWAGAWAALILALAPGHVVAAQAARPDALFTLLLALNLWCAARLLRGMGSKPWHLAAAGVLLGVSVATRFPAALWWLGYAAALLMAARVPGQRRHAWLASLAVISGIALVAYALASPHSLRHGAVLLDGLATQFNYQRATTPGAHGGVLAYGGRVMAEAIGIACYVPLVLALLYALLRRERADGLLAVFALPYFVSLTTSQWVVVRYFVPLLPLLAIWTGALLARALAGGASWRALGLALATFALGVNALTLVVYGQALRAPDTRDRTLAWLAAHAPEATRIGVLQAYDGDVFFHPPAIARYRWRACVLGECQPARFFDSDAELFVVADTYLVDVNVAGQAWHVARALAVRDDLEIVARFAPLADWRGYDIRPQFQSQDMHDALTTLTVYRRRAGGSVRAQH